MKRRSHTCPLFNAAVLSGPLICTTHRTQACFVCCQYWCTAMFSPNVVGTANAFAGGWGNLGGGATQLVRLLIVADFIKCCAPMWWAPPTPSPAAGASRRRRHTAGASANLKEIFEKVSRSPWQLDTAQYGQQLVCSAVCSGQG